jgi:hypothetical protein
MLSASSPTLGLREPGPEPGYFDSARLSPDADSGMPRSVIMARPGNKEKFYRYFLEKLASDLWLQELYTKHPQGKMWHNS